MQLTIRDLLPVYFEEERKKRSEIWGKEIVFQRGELTKIIAPSGSGKTSLMHFLYGIRREYTGDILYDQQSLRTIDPETLSGFRSSQVSIVFQDMRLLPEQTVMENLEIKRQLNPYHNEDKVRQMAERLGVGSKLASLGRTCSYGEQQRIAIIRSLMQPFDFLLLDEPFSHLDNRNAEKAMELMLEEAAVRGASIIFADLERIDFFPFTRLFYL
ncbi:MAG: ABC transporter [Sphingobacteriales bacterium SCN 48-20]|uniref:ATP-binding cassette domain-containing protein n=1 Tax=Terrimonas ferruginea TaxID=249 RepID=UPI00086C1E35|nr:ATP-binding cassette domain-containing protein [Terrimonas ferruginea]MBN8781516.1 ATP-binding cassette domain-containing protein [Terrimonas ferruginea]ODT94856.1 MAG: ABC transporter [Sphingobacteriales bacterium SCN 48-20]OJW45189.1 MAG: ABC transporter [Sphingobacteriales bacterium 48-107]